MSIRNRRISREEFAARGERIFHCDIEPALRAEDLNKYVAIDIETGRFAVDADDYAATEQLLRKSPEAQIWLVRVGHPAAYRIGGRAIVGGQE
jgi:hypothetical protein